MIDPEERGVIGAFVKGEMYLWNMADWFIQNRWPDGSTRIAFNDALRSYTSDASVKGERERLAVAHFGVASAKWHQNNDWDEDMGHRARERAAAIIDAENAIREVVTEGPGGSFLAVLIASRRWKREGQKPRLDEHCRVAFKRLQERGEIYIDQDYNVRYRKGDE